MTSGQKLDEEFVAAVIAIFAKAARETLEAGVPIFGRDDGIDIMVRPDGTRFEIRYIPNATGENRYEIIRQLHRTAA